MGNKLILVEGIPGAGKTTTARKIKEQLLKEGKKVLLYEEGMSHPADMAWNAYLTTDEYKSFLNQCFKMWEESQKTINREELMNRIQVQARHEDCHVILAYTRIEFPEGCYWSLIDEIAAKEICDGRRELNQFKKIHLNRWTKFAENAMLDDYTYIFECAFLQNHIFELLGVYEKNDEEILNYLKDLLSTVQCLKPSIVYINPKDVEKVIMEAAKERKSLDNSSADWIDEIATWVSTMNYGKRHNLTGKEGVFSFCKERLRIDQVMISKLGIPVKVINRE